MTDSHRGLGPARPSPTRGLALAYAGGALLLIAAYATPAFAAAAPLLYLIVAGSAVTALVVGVRAHRPDAPRSWYLLAAGQALLILGDASDLVDGARSGPRLGPIWPGGGFWLAAFAMVLAALIGLLRAQCAAVDQLAVLDAAIVGVASVLVIWVYVVAPAADKGSLAISAQLLAVTYPTLALLIAVCAARAWPGTGHHGWSARCLTASMVAGLIGTTLLSGHLVGRAVPGPVMHVCWLGAYAAVGTAALDPTMRVLTAPRPAAAAPGWLSLPLLAASSTLGPGVLLVEALHGHADAVPFAAVSSCVLFGLVLARVAAASARLAARADRRFSGLVQASSDLILVVDSGGIVRYATPSVARRLGRPDGAFIGGPVTQLLPEADAHRLGVLPPHTPERLDATPVECRLPTGSGPDVVEVLRANLSTDEAADGVVLAMREVAERHTMEIELRRLAYTDALTGTANRVQLRERLTTVLASAPQAGALLMLDLDDFKLVNDVYGHSHGDGLLVEAARRLQIVADQFEDACLARLGGDEFALLLPDVTLQEARWVCAGLLNRLRQPVGIGSADLDVGTSIGLVMLNPDRRDVDALLRDGDLAMYAAKADGKNQWKVFEPAMYEELVDRLTLEGELTSALDEDQLDLHYQPLVDLDGQRIVGVEALIRWNHPRRGLLTPDKFLPAAEHGPLIHRVGAWVLRTACQQLVDWSHQVGTDTLREIAVNVSPRQLLDSRFTDTVAEALATTGLQPGRLVLEITESTAMNPNLSQDQLQALQALGVRLAIDDFGTGHSSLSRLALLPVDILKIDRSFVQAIPTTGEEPLIRAITAMARSLGLSLVAEGIETDRQRHYLTSLGCEQGQGYLFARPLPAALLTNLVAHAAAARGSTTPSVPAQPTPTTALLPTGDR